MKIIDCDQGSPEWYYARRGIPTASEFKSILTQTSLRLSKSADKYAAQLIGERLSEILPEGVENYTSRAMRWGQETEEEARRYFALQTGLDVRKVGFITTDDGRFGCSPDALVYDKEGELIGGLELKCPEPTAHVEYLIGGVLPDEHRAQVHGGLIVTGLKRWWFMSYAPGLDALIRSVVPDAYTFALSQALDEFHPRLMDLLRKVKGE